MEFPLPFERHGKDLGVVVLAGGNLLARGDVAAVSKIADTARLLFKRQAKEPVACFECLLCSPIELVFAAHLKNSVASPRGDDGMRQGDIGLGASDRFRKGKCLQVCHDILLIINFSEVLIY